MRGAKAGDKPVKMFDGGGLYLYLSPVGAQVVSAPQRLAALPNVSTSRRSGLGPSTVPPTVGSSGPRARPARWSKKIYNATRQAPKDPAVRKSTEGNGSLIVANTPEQFTAQIKADFEVYEQAMAKPKLSLD